MIVFLITAYILLVISGVLFFYLHNRVEALSISIKSILQGQQVLRDNQTVLYSEIKKIHNELQLAKKEYAKKEIVKYIDRGS